MKCIIHVGIHKTGSTSIQAALSRLESVDFQYLLMDRENHSVPIRTLFGSDPMGHPALKRKGYTSPPDVQKYRDKWLSEFYQQVKGAKRNLIISGEDLSLEGGEEVLEKLRAALSPYFQHFHVIAYVRRPVSYTESAFQEVIKNGGTFFKPELHFPKYRQRLEQLEAVFGRDSVEYVLFDRAELYGKDVVIDFFQRVGIKEAPGGVIEDNQSLNMAALSAVYNYRRMRRHLMPLSAAENNELVSVARRLEGEKFRFSPAIMSPLLEKYSSEVEWMESRLGQSLEEAPASGFSCAKESDLFILASKLVDEMKRVYLGVVDDASLEPVAFDLLASVIEAAGDRTRREGQVLSDQLLAECRERGVAIHVVLRELSLALYKLGYLELAEYAINQALTLNPKGEALKRVKELIYSR